METKICTKCKEEKTFDVFTKTKLNKSGLHSNCIHCKREGQKKWREKNKEKIASSKKVWNSENKEKERLRSKIRNNKNKEKLVLKAKTYRDKNKEKIRCKQKSSYDKLSDSYIKSKLKNSGFSKEQIEKNTELIEVKRLIIKTKRLCETSQN